jgi:Leucine-rich repeat (LRR) protein
MQQPDSPMYVIDQTDMGADVLLTLLRTGGDNNISLLSEEGDQNTITHKVTTLMAIASDPGLSRKWYITVGSLYYGLPSSLRELWLANYRIPRLPQNFGSLVPNLKRLTIDNCALEELPESIGQLANLHILRLQENHLQAIPSSIRYLTRLRVLRINENPGLSVIGSSIGSLPSLQILNARDCGIRFLPRDISGLLGSIHIIRLDNNHLGTGRVPWNALSRAPNLKTLILNNNPLGEIGPFDGTFPGLRQLELNSTRLRVLPDRLFRITTLRILKLSDNFFTEIPPAIRNLQSLEWLYLNNCVLLRSLPLELLEIPTLRVIVANMPPHAHDDDGNPRMHPLHESVNYQIIQEELYSREEGDHI